MATQKSSVKIIFFGTSEFAVPALEALVSAGYDIVAVITQPDKPTGRKQVLTPPLVKLAAQKFGLPVLQPEKLKGNEEFLTTLNTKYLIHNTDLGIVASYGKLIPPEILNLPKRGLLNIHPSLLPKYRGSSPIQTVLLSGDTETGVTIIKIDEEMDHGEIVSSIRYQVSRGDNYKFLENKLARAGAELLIKTLPGYLAGRIKPVPQNESQATFTKKFTTTDGEIKPDDTPETAYNKIRALNPEPGTFVVLPDGKKLKILTAEPPTGLPALTGGSAVTPPGLSFVENRLAFNLKGGYIIIKTVQPEGKKPMPGADFARGYFK